MHLRCSWLGGIVKNVTNIGITNIGNYLNHKTIIGSKSLRIVSNKNIRQRQKAFKTKSLFLIKHFFEARKIKRQKGESLSINNKKNQQYLFDWADLRHSRRKPNLQPSGVIPTRREQSRKIGKIILKWVITACRWRLRCSRGSVLAFGTQVRGFKPGRSCRIFQGKRTSARLPSEGK